jgi:uncharacterized protein
MVEALFILFPFALEQRFMRLELKDIQDSGLEQSLSFAATEFPILAQMQQDEVGFVAPLQFRLRFQKSGQLVEVNGHLETVVALSCGRCLQAYEKDLRSDFALTFTPYVAEEQDVEDEAVEVELDTDELGLVYYQDDCLELTQPLQDQVIMALPISPTCFEDCAGLCPECGCNLNVESCNCEKKIFNSKFSALAGLKIESSKE